MDRDRPAESPELTTVGVLPVQSFVTPAVEVPPGTPARPRPDRPPLPPESPSASVPHRDSADRGEAEQHEPTEGDI
jgi:hypothetical protein